MATSTMAMHYFQIQRQQASESQLQGTMMGEVCAFLSCLQVSRNSWCDTVSNRILDWKVLWLLQQNSLYVLMTGLENMREGWQMDATDIFNRIFNLKEFLPSLLNLPSQQSYKKNCNCSQVTDVRLQQNSTYIICQ